MVRDWRAMTKRALRFFTARVSSELFLKTRRTGSRSWYREFSMALSEDTNEPMRRTRFYWAAKLADVGRCFVGAILDLSKIKSSLELVVRFVTCELTLRMMSSVKVSSGDALLSISWSALWFLMWWLWEGGVIFFIALAELGVVARRLSKPAGIFYVP